jgi:hypothetical protein
MKLVEQRLQVRSNAPSPDFNSLTGAVNPQTNNASGAKQQKAAPEKPQ